MRKRKIPQNNKWAWKVVALVAAVITIGVVVGVANGWFGGQKVELDVEYYNTNRGFVEIDPNEYESLVNGEKSFMVFVDQSGCTTADRLREYMKIYMEQNKVSVYKIMFEDIRNTSLHDFIKYYPSIAIVEKGKVKTYLRADSDEDVGIYNNYSDFEQWIDKYLRKY